ncbi:MAG: geranylgeranylglycerol-phosphate geranylgeranyltransferase [Flavobacteriales bacterium]|jgi:4-hydroxybenzoate polyprenyltransferase|nr:geranylgeranylglycerol-phosphate geranylgeranyltransferase [Flavobacteriales bacterium]MBK6893857.1 geranylgeranylglycerol-phosphate geranylgeranyltransferase [Flavobacteriales bacterium]MBK7247801.1 geranylgeranylglycerol-phosphate geranylgeranyltransferase [Flavobacteriales bacterium]MBK9060358.1 geranylgeranylglycerol-phosphate geranylgeranyltransferase [Flavobacteriales bacterium]MBK9597178.1 geranylgeranylglycerol-phosphate geranylgeranyltransferase [Flavobacteriales bacterium]
MGAFLRLTRPLNLLIIAFTMVAIRYGVIGGYLEVSSVDLRHMAPSPDVTLFAQVPDNTFVHAFNELLFWLLVCSTVLIAAGGNVINDYFDTRIDRVNKPDEVIVGRSVKRRVAMMGHLVLTALGILIGAVVAWRSGQLHLAVIPVFAAGALWYYSTKLKRTFLLGNGLVALLVALVPLSVGLYEIPALTSAYGNSASANIGGGQELEVVFHFNELWPWILGFTAFAFLTTLVRELQKDMADIKGDKADGCRTVPIVMGVNWAKALTLFYLAVAIIALLLLRAVVLTDKFSYWYIGAGVVLPMLLSAGFTYGANDRNGFNTAGHILKFAMAIAVAFAFFILKVL